MQAIELFAGAGGLGIGVSNAGFRPILVVERDQWCVDTLKENRATKGSVISKWPEPLLGDIRDVDFKAYCEKVAIVTGGPPCQPFSLGGQHRAHADDRDMWNEAVRTIREVRPEAFIFENVKGLTRQTFATYFGYITLQLQHPSISRIDGEQWQDHLRRLQRHHTGNKDVEYRVVHQLVNTANYGIPQKRERVVFVGFRNGIDAKWTFPKETHSQDALLFDQMQSGAYWDRHSISKRQRAISPKLEARGKGLHLRPPSLPWLTVRDAFVGLPDPERISVAGSFSNHRFQAGARTYPGHTGSPLDEPAKTLKAGVHGVPGGENMMRRADGSVRYFTVRESARLQTFPDSYVLHGSWSEAMRQLGNAVPVKLGEILATSVRKHLLTANKKIGMA